MISVKNNDARRSIQSSMCTMTCLTLMVLSFKSRTWRDLNVEMFGVSVPGKPLPSSFNLIVLSASPQLIPYHLWWPMWGSIIGAPRPLITLCGIVEEFFQCVSFNRTQARIINEVKSVTKHRYCASLGGSKTRKTWHFMSFFNVRFLRSRCQFWFNDT